MGELLKQSEDIQPLWRNCWSCKTRIAGILRVRATAR